MTTTALNLDTVVLLAIAALPPTALNVTIIAENALANLELVDVNVTDACQATGIMAKVSRLRYDAEVFDSLERSFFLDGCVPCSCNTELSRGLGCNPITG